MKVIQNLWKSPWSVWVGLRHLRKKGSFFLNFITLISVGGVAIGVTAMILVLSVMDGFEVQLKKRLYGGDIHLLITPLDTAPQFDRGFVPQDSLEKSGGLKALKEHPLVSDIFPVVSTEAILKTGSKISGVVIKGISKERLERVRSQLTEVANAAMLEELSQGEKIKRPGAFVGQELAYMLGLIPGDFVTLVSPTETEGPLDSIPRSKRFVVEGIYSSGLPDQELHTVFVTDQSIFSFIKKKDVLTHWEITSKNFEKSPEIAKSVAPFLKDYRVQDWVQLNSTLFASLKLERLAMFIVLGFIVIVASFNIVTTLTLMVIEKRREISIFRTMGASQDQVSAIFMAEGLLIGTLGVLFGVICAGVLSFFLKRYEFIQLPDIYYDRTLPVTFEPTYYAVVAVSTFLIVLLACLYPSRRAAALDPLEGIRLGK